MAAKLITQAMLAVTLVGIAFVAARRPGEETAPPSRLGLGRIDPPKLGWAFAALGGQDFAAQLSIPFSVVTTAQARVGRPLTPVSVAGVARRTARRCAARVYYC